MEREFDVVCVGAGPCGEAVATELAGAGLSLAVVEAGLVGGECPYWGCVPSKTMIRSAEVLKEAARAGELAASRIEWELDYPKIAKRVSWMARDLDDARPAAAISEHATLVRGRGRLAGPRTVTAGDDTLVARRALVVCTGTSPAIPPLPGLEGADLWTNREAVLAKQLPKSLVVLGGGAVGVELAQAFARFGVEVTVVEGAERLVPLEEPEAGDLLRVHLEADGVKVVTGARVTAARARHGRARLDLKGAEAVTAERLLVATGRRPNLDPAEAAAAGLRPDARGWLKPYPGTLLAADGIYAGGDVTGIAGFTHLAHYHGTLIGRSLRGESRRPNHDAIPRVTFTDPEIGAVGLTEAQAREGGLEVRAVSADAAETARGYIHGFTGGLAKLVVEPGRGRLVGATIVSPRAGEMVGELALAIRAQVSLRVLADTLHGFPTFSRVLQGVLDEAARG